MGTYDEKVNASLMHEYSFKALTDTNLVLAMKCEDAIVDFRTLQKYEFVVSVTGTGLNLATFIVSDKVSARFHTLSLSDISCAFQVEADSGGEGGDESSDTDSEKKRKVKAAKMWGPQMNTFVARSVKFDSSSALIDCSDVKVVDFDVASLASCQCAELEPTRVVAGDLEVTRLVFTGKARWRIESRNGTQAVVQSDDSITFDFRGHHFVLEKDGSAKIVNDEAVIMASEVTISQTWQSDANRPGTVQADGELKTRFETDTCPFSFKGIEHWVVEKPMANSEEQKVVLHAPFYVGQKLNVTIEGMPFPAEFKNLVQVDETIELALPDNWEIGTMGINGKEYFGYTFAEGLTVRKTLVANFSKSSLTGTVTISVNNFTSLPLLHSFETVEMKHLNVSMENEHKEFLTLERAILCAYTMKNCDASVPQEYEIGTDEQRLTVTYFCGDFPEWPEQTCVGVTTNVTVLPHEGGLSSMTTIIVVSVCVATIVISVTGASIYFCLQPKKHRRAKKMKADGYKNELLDDGNEDMVKL